MRFIAGPRQVGKTTLAKTFLHEQNCQKFYYNWDLRSIKDRYKSDPYFYHSEAIQEKNGKIWFCFDEIHKFPKWKDVLKDAFDSFENKYRFIVTGSARLDLFRKAGDSLSGRYFLFRLLPLSLFEITGSKLELPTGNAKTFVEESISEKCFHSELSHLLIFSGFPEPFTKGDETFSSNWHEGYIDTLIRGDLRDLTKIHELENVANLMYLLPERIGSPLSLNSLMEDISVSYNAVKNYIRALILTYVIFSVQPYSKKMARMIKKESKVYFYDWSLIKDEAKRFENYVACELKHRMELWTSVTKYKFELYFIRTRDGKETDFLITKDSVPYLLVEAKLSSENLESHNILHSERLNVPLVQVVHKKDVLRASSKNTYIVSASNFFG